MNGEGGRIVVLGGIPDLGMPRRMHCGYLPFEPKEEGQWQSTGGDSGHPDRNLPRSLDLMARDGRSAEGLHILGAFAMHGGGDGPHTVGLTIRLMDGTRLAHKVELRAGVHYTDADDRSLRDVTPGDGTEIKTVGCCLAAGRMVRLDLLSIDLPSDLVFDRVQFVDAGTPASFAILEVALTLRSVSSCPFRSSSGGISLSDLASIVRVRDRVRFSKAIEQLERSLNASEDLDEARSEALTFVAIVTAGKLESGAPRSLHRIQLEAARRFERAAGLDELREATMAVLHEVAGELLGEESSAQDRQIDRALAIIARNFGQPISDESIAQGVGLSTSHFRHLFREVTGQPFHRYLVALRLERARAMLERQALSVGDVAGAVGFHNLAHFSRAFTQRFGASPTATRKGRPGS